VLMFHHFGSELRDELKQPIQNYLVRSTEFAYSEGPVASYLLSVTQSGYVHSSGGRYLKKSMPPLDFEYSEVPDAEDLAGRPVEEIDAADLENLPAGISGSGYQFLDLDGTGISDPVTEQGAALWRKPNLSPRPMKEGGVSVVRARFGALERAALLPAGGLMRRGRQLLDLAGDGQPDLVEFGGPMPGFWENDPDEGWKPFTPFRSLPRLDWNDPNLKFIDLNGDGHADILITEDDVFTWYPSLAEDGFGEANRVAGFTDEENGPALVFADGAESVYLADMSGDGLTDIVRIRNGEVCYWPNIGYGRFGAKVTMDRPPLFDHQDLFSQKRVRLADIDGSGTTDVLYLGAEVVRVYFNQSGNSLSDPALLPQFPAADDPSSLQVMDLLGSGTACLVRSSPLPGTIPLEYVRLMEEKPHLLVSVKNNLGAETIIRYAPSTRFYLEDEFAGRPWITRLPFPVHVVERVETYDRISRNRFVTRYAYHHGYFDGEEREFRGFGRVEQWDTEEIPALTGDGAFPPDTNTDPASHVPPVRTVTWFHTGAYLEGGKISLQLAHEYFGAPSKNRPDYEAAFETFLDTLLPDTILPEGTAPADDGSVLPLTLDEEREACRALKGSMLRQEVYAEDGSEKEAYPYTVVEQNFGIRCLQPQFENRHAVFFAHPRESISYNCERDPDDPRIGHQLTLEVDDYGNVKKSAAVGYGRSVADESLSTTDQEKQSRTLITYTESDFTKQIEDPLAYQDAHRTPLPCEVRTYELTGYDPTGRAGRFQMEDFVKEDPDNPGRLMNVNDTEIYYEDSPGSEKTRRLIEHVRTLYRSDNMNDLLALGAMDSRALPGEAYKLAFTPGLLRTVYRRDTGEELISSSELPGILEDEGGYRSSERLVGAGLFPAEGDSRRTLSDGNGHWWIPSGRTYYRRDEDLPSAEEEEAKAHFFVPRRIEDPFGNDTFLDYDGYDLLITGTEDVLGNKVTAENDYRVLQPKIITDPNENDTEAAFDALGLVAATAVMGKKTGGGAHENGDSVEDVIADPTDEELAGFFSLPKARAASLLDKATTRIVYDLDRYRRTRQAYPDDPENWLPACASTLAREMHVAPGNVVSPIQVNFSFSDGFGREIQKKIQAEKGTVPVRDVTGKIQVDSDGRPVMSGDEREPRWVGNGWTVFNNKGKAVRQYEPFFTDTHEFEFDVRIGVSPILFYDPVERVIATLHPNRTYEKVVFDPWRKKTYDVNDTVATTEDETDAAQTGDPRTDPDVKDYAAGYFETLPAEWQTWYQERISGGKGPAEQQAAEKAAQHANTPTVAHFDVLGRTFLTMAHNRFDKQQNGGAPVTVEEKYPTRVDLDIEGNQREVRDEVKTDAAGRERVVMRYDYCVAGPEQSEEKKAANLIHQASMEAGERWLLNDVSGKPIRTWDSGGFIRCMAYDQLRRPTDLYVTEGGSKRLAERTIYGEVRGSTDNHRTRVYQVQDGAGTLTNESYDFKGNLLQSARELLTECEQAIDWLANPQPNGDRFVTRTTYDALNRPTSITTPDHSVYIPAYNEANLLESVDVRLQGGSPPAPFVTNIDYNEKGQRSLIEYGNASRAEYEYDADTFRLVRLKTTRQAGLNGQSAKIFADPRIVQDLHYTYDPAGNITRIEDAALKTVIYGGEQVEPVCEYTYDAIYRLIEASGREHSGQSAIATGTTNENRRDYPFAGVFDLQAHPNDLQALRNYREKYEYDAAGNFKTVKHAATNYNWTRTYICGEDSPLGDGNKNNRLTKTTLGNGFNQVENYAYNPHGCMTAIDGLGMGWDFKDQLHHADFIGGGHAYYVYDAGGQRVRKIWKKSDGSIEERIYLGNFELFRKTSGGAPSLTRATLHIMDDKQRIAIVETRIMGIETGIPPQLIRYQYGNHLGSACLELADDGAFISLEEYHPYGTTSFQAGPSAAEVSLKRYRYTGKERDEETGLDYYGARYYASWLGRWISCDPAGLVDGMNLFIFGSNNSINRVDSYGMSDNPVDQADLLIGKHSDVGGHHPVQGAAYAQKGVLDPFYRSAMAISQKVGAFTNAIHKQANRVQSLINRALWSSVTGKTVDKKVGNVTIKTLTPEETRTNLNLQIVSQRAEEDLSSNKSKPITITGVTGSGNLPPTPTPTLEELKGFASLQTTNEIPAEQARIVVQQASNERAANGSVPVRIPNAPRIAEGIRSIQNKATSLRNSALGAGKQILGSLLLPAYDEVTAGGTFSYLEGLQINFMVGREMVRQGAGVVQQYGSQALALGTAAALTVRATLSTAGTAAINFLGRAAPVIGGAVSRIPGPFIMVINPDIILQDDRFGGRSNKIPTA
jgi:RHS repeat-associated protein